MSGYLLAFQQPRRCQQECARTNRSEPPRFSRSRPQPSEQVLVLRSDIQPGATRHQERVYLSTERAVRHMSLQPDSAVRGNRLAGRGAC